MKRRYKAGDWFHIPLIGEFDAIGIIARADRSRLFGYFFQTLHARLPEHAELRRLRAHDALLCAQFGGLGLEEHRWKLIATSLPFDANAWPFPPDAEGRYANPDQLEALLCSRIAGEPPELPLAVCEIRSPIDRQSLQVLAHGGRLQFSEPLAVCDVQALAEFLKANAHVELRVHGWWSGGFDLAMLEQFRDIHALVLDTPEMRNEHMLASLPELRTLRIGPTVTPVRLEALSGSRHLHALDLRGAHADVGIVSKIASLLSLTLVATASIDLATLAAASNVRALTLAHGTYDLSKIRALPALERLELRAMRLERLPDLSASTQLQSIVMRDVRDLRDLAPLTAARNVRDLVIEDMPQLEVWDFETLRAWRRLPALSIEIGSRTKSREVYRMLRAGIWKK